jgi:fatty-acid desaturase
MFQLNVTLRGLGLFSIVAITWIFGSIELYDTLANFSTQWYWWVLATAYTIVVNELFVHEFCHHSMKDINTNTWTYKIMMFLASIDNAYVPVTGQCLMHANHHDMPDTDYDHAEMRKTWHDLFLLSPWLFLNQRYENFDWPGRANYIKQQEKIYKTVLDDIWTFFCEEYRIFLTLSIWLLLYLICPIILFKILFMGRFLMSIYQFCVNVPGHIMLPFGYQNYKEQATSWNNLWAHYIMLGLSHSALHNNHHGISDRRSVQRRWFEFDTGRYVLAWFRRVMIKSV